MHIAPALISRLACALFAACLSACALAAGPDFSVQIGKPVISRDIPSGSGMTPNSDGYYVVGDDSPYLFDIDRRYAERTRTLLKDNPTRNGRIPPKLKPDFEAMANFRHEQDNWLLIVGSGSKPGEREWGFLISEDLENRHMRSLAPLYRQLREAGALSEQQRLNIEGLAVAGQQVYFLNRGNSGPNLIFRAALDEVVAYMQGKREALSRIERFDARLPAVSGFEATFSGADYWPELDALVFTASVEARSDGYADGEVLGSFIGLLRLEQLRPGVTLDLAPHMLRLARKGRALQTKAESLAITSSDTRTVQGALVSDNDDGSSVFFNFALSLKP